MKRFWFRGFHRDKNGSSEIYLNGEWIRGEWVRGGYVAYDDAVDGKNSAEYIAEQDIDAHKVGEQVIHLIEVIPETVGQYIGAEDRNTQPVFESDILADKFGNRTRVEFKNSEFQLVTPNGQIHCPYRVSEREVIGNIFNTAFYEE